MVLTAAHCVTPQLDGVPDPTVVLGREGALQPAGYLSARTTSHVHPGFNAGSGFDYDVAALVLEQPVQKQQPVTLVLTGDAFGLGVSAQGDANPPAFRYHTWRGTEGEAASSSQAAALRTLQLRVLGWGATGSGGLPSLLQQGATSPLPLSECARQFSPFASHVTQRMLCLTGVF